MKNSAEPSSNPSLTPRQQEVLAAIVRRHIETGTPVGSRTISKTNSEGLSAATIRGIMADLEDAGFISHPHTSAGRVPTDRGYRYYVDALDDEPGVATAECDALARSLYEEGGLDSVLSRCCRLLSEATHNVSIGTSPEFRTIRFRHVEFVKLSAERLLVLFIASSGHVYQYVIDARVPESQGELNRYALYVNEELHDRTLLQVRDRLAALMREERTAYDTLARRALQLAAEYFTLEPELEPDLVVDGTERLLERPDLSEFDRMKALVRALDDKSRIVRLLNSCIHEGRGVITTIGSEARAPELEGCSLVAASYGLEEQPIGTLGIIGPTRMDYERARALVGHAARLLGAALASSRE